MIRIVTESDGSQWVTYGDYVRDLESLRAWMRDLQAGMYINCAYCGHRYGPEDEVPAAMADVLKEHIEECPEHPMHALKARIAELEAQAEEPSPEAASDRACAR